MRPPFWKRCVSPAMIRMSGACASRTVAHISRTMREAPLTCITPPLLAAHVPRIATPLWHPLRMIHAARRQEEAPKTAPIDRSGAEKAAPVHAPKQTPIGATLTTLREMFSTRSSGGTRTFPDMRRMYSLVAPEKRRLLLAFALLLSLIHI